MLIDAQKRNLKKLMQQYSFEHLLPGHQVYRTSIAEDQIFVDTGNGLRRRIYFKQTYSQNQKQAIEQTRVELTQLNCFEKFSEQLILKHVYSAKFIISAACERLLMVAEFHSNPTITDLTQRTIQMLQLGCIYTYGVDRQFHPIVVLRCDKFDWSLSVQQNFNCVYYLMLVVMGFKMVPYHAEKYIVIFDFNQMDVSDIPYRYLYDVFAKMNVYYCANIQKTYVFNTKGISLVWSVVSRVLPEYQRKRVIFVDDDRKQLMLEYIDPAQLERKYGGKLDNLEEFWPPKCTAGSQKYDEEDQTEYLSVVNDEAYFRSSQVTARGNTCDCSCSIY